MMDSEFLQWIHDRLVNVYGEDPNTDFILKLNKIVAKTKEQEERDHIIANMRKDPNYIPMVAKTKEQEDKDSKKVHITTYY